MFFLFKRQFHLVTTKLSQLWFQLCDIRVKLAINANPFIVAYFGQHRLLQRDIDDVQTSISLSNQKKLALGASSNSIYYGVCITHESN